MRTRHSLVLAVALLVAPSISSGAGSLVVRVSGPSPFPIGDCRPVDQLWWGEKPGEETDPSIAINPLDSKNVVAAWVQDDAYGIVAASSFDGGATWTRTVVPGLTRCTGGEEDHILHARLSFGGDGRLYLTGETLDGFFPDPRAGVNHIPVVTSIDGGLTWSAPSRVDDLPAFNGFDRIAAEPDVAGAAVVVWHGPEGAASAYLSRTIDGGVSWTKHRMPINPEFQPFQSVLATPDGGIVVFYSDNTILATAALIADAAFGVDVDAPTSLFAIRSDDKGLTWSSPTAVISNVPAEWTGTAAGSDGSVYATMLRPGPAGTELIAVRSPDGGTTWNAPVIIATDAEGPFPNASAQPDGTLGIGYRAKTPAGSVLMLATSDDHGATWTTTPMTGPFQSESYGFYQETAASGNGFASVFIRSGPDTDGPTDVFVAIATN